MNYGLLYTWYISNIRSLFILVLKLYHLTQWKPFQGGSFAFWDDDSISLLQLPSFWHKRYSKLILYISCHRPKSSNFSKKFWFFCGNWYLEALILGARGAYYFWFSIAFRSLKWTELRNMCSFARRRILWGFSNSNFTLWSLS